MNLLSRSSNVPLYKQISDDIIQKLQTGMLEPGDKIPSETELAELYEVSRMTVRQALNELIRERKLIRKRGFGTFVADRIVQRIFHPNVVTGFYDEFNRGATALKSIVVEKALVYPPAVIANLMGLDNKTLACKLTRIRILEDQPLIIDESYIDKKLWDSIKHQNFENISLFGFISELIGIKPESAEIEIYTESASQKTANYLQISQGQPILKLLMTNRNEDGTILHVGRLYCPDNMGLKFTIGKNKF